MTVIGSIGVYSTGQRFAYGGMSSACYPLISSLHRQVGGGKPEVRTAELEMITEAREWGLGTHPTRKVDDLQLLSDLQHCGIATRLLDVTSNPMTALWFACQKPRDPRVAMSNLLLAMNITGWRRLSTVADADGVHQRQPRGTGAPRALPFVAMIIPAGVNGRLLKYLEGSYNRSARVLFPDYEGYRQFGARAPRRIQTLHAGASQDRVGYSILGGTRGDASAALWRFADRRRHSSVRPDGRRSQT